MDAGTSTAITTAITATTAHILLCDGKIRTLAPDAPAEQTTRLETRGAALTWTEEDSVRACIVDIDRLPCVASRLYQWKMERCVLEWQVVIGRTCKPTGE